mmetsp:Transcript_102438/g.264883  ORF Transcript_102438/g.264883 Transcript_102438/m.264883 type:complete len:262 (-) Transcript_102438:1528-2313(-)
MVLVAAQALEERGRLLRRADCHARVLLPAGGRRGVRGTGCALRRVHLRRGAARGGGATRGRLLRRGLRGVPRLRLGQPRVVKGIHDRHPLVWHNLHESQDEVHRFRGQVAAPALREEELRDVTALEEEPVRVLSALVGGEEQRLGHEEVEGAPAEAPRVDLRGQVRRLRVDLRRPEVLADEAPERDGLLLARARVDDERGRLPGVAQLHVPVAVVHHMQEHVLHRHVLHGEAAEVQAGQALRGVEDQLLCLVLGETVRTQA